MLGDYKKYIKESNKRGFKWQTGQMQPAIDEKARSKDAWRPVFRGITQIQYRKDLKYPHIIRAWQKGSLTIDLTSRRWVHTDLVTVTVQTFKLKFGVNVWNRAMREFKMFVMKDMREKYAVPINVNKWN